ncbi:glycoside hydrolase 15-related [Catenulispora acidiphila DSM 44928]|uniref:Glycoside hydrolase 15-related n=1 Tax=Catenulispora acidiphila (strain DSM 44928 / JCM 14897 / NBRC 102108 / NRRL B-24433 / ID139908) TaxID=479433 RepID=C7QHQ0_CATAD|nr:glycoside hydrolase family 15 protein [Catenulispora acidiphila]ACU71075.1 glycoside hydrolase 15-related [Catenulispora acidiphila DSM 44928]
MTSTTPPYYPAIDDHGLLGDLRTCALVAGDGAVDWFCPGRFDAPSVFGALLDRERGGAFRIWVEGAASSQSYLPRSAVVVTRFESPDGGVGEIVDFMVPDEARASFTPGTTTLYRIVRAVAGDIQFSVDCRPRFDYGRSFGEPVELVRRGGTQAAVFSGPDCTLSLLSTAPLGLDADSGSARAEVLLGAGEAAAFVLVASLATPEDWEPDVAAEVERALEEALIFWHGWLSQSTYRGRWADPVHRSAITLKLLTYSPTGAFLAAATTGLPEEIGGFRNWDYRYTWIRDGSFSARALSDLGFHEEAEAFARWVTGRLADGPTSLGEPLHIMYRVDGTADLLEEELPHWEGYRRSAPVRIGNGAAEQLQLDIYGEFLYSLAGTEHLHSPEGQAAVGRLLDWLVEHWARPDEGIWETRGGRRDFTYSRLMCWAAFEYGLRIAPTHENAGMWAVMAHSIAGEIRTKGWDEDQQAYIQTYGDAALDASILFMPMVGFTTPHEERWTGTLNAIERSLIHNGLCHRYRLSEFSDGLAGDESSFDLCTTLYHIALAQSGAVEQAQKLFEAFLRHAGPTGLFAEELTPGGQQLGNYPQAFTHLGVIWAALALDEALDRVGDGSSESRGAVARG